MLCQDDVYDYRHSVDLIQNRFNGQRNIDSDFRQKMTFMIIVIPELDSRNVILNLIQIS